MDMDVTASAPLDEPGVLESSVEIEVSTPALRDEVLKWLIDEVTPLTQGHPRISHVEFASGKEPELIELTMLIQGKSFREASRITKSFLESVDELVRQKTDLDKSISVEPMSRTLVPA